MYWQRFKDNCPMARSSREMISRTYAYITKELEDTHVAPNYLETIILEIL